jgi:hypothetical protein
MSRLGELENAGRLERRSTAPVPPYVRRPSR